MTAGRDAMGADEGAVETSQRLDKWLWQARFFKTRTIAAKFVNSGNVRMTRGESTVRIAKASATVRPGDVIVFTQHERVRIIAILACAARRGPASEARELYEDRSPPPPPKEQARREPFSRDKGAGRPTKKDRRALAALQSGD